MRARAGMVIAITAFICFFLNSVLFDKINLWDIRPDMVIALAVTLGITVGSLHSGLVCGGVGLLWDILFYKQLGLNAAIYLLAGVVCGKFFRKFYANNALIPALLGFGFSLLKDNIFALIVALGHARFSYALILVSYMLPCAVFTGIMCIPLFYCLRPLLARYGKYLSEKRDNYT